MSSSGAGGGASTAAVNALTGAALQPGVVHSGDAAISAISIGTGTGAVAFTLAAATAYVLSAGGVLTNVTFGGGAETPAASAPASTKYAVVGVEMDTGGNVTVIKGTDTATQLNTAALIASNTPATSSGKVRLWDFAVWNNAGTYNFGDHTTTATQGTNYIDRRPWARGAKWTTVLTGGSYTKNTATIVPIDSTNLSARIECSGALLRLRLLGTIEPGSAANTSTDFLAYLDGVAVTGARSEVSNTTTAFGIAFANALLDCELTPAAGSHLLVPYWTATTSGTSTLLATTTYALTFTIEEIVRSSANNGTV